MALPDIPPPTTATRMVGSSHQSKHFYAPQMVFILGDHWQMNNAFSATTEADRR